MCVMVCRLYFFLGAYTPPHCPGAHASIFLGSSWFGRSSPWPRQPCSPLPHVKTAPSAVMNGEAVVCSCRHGDDPLPSEGLDLLRQQLTLLVAVAQPAKGANAPAPDAAVGGEGEAVVVSSRHSEDALASQD